MSPGLHLLDEVELKHLRAVVTTHGLSGAARVLDLSRGVVSAALGGIGVRKGSLELLREALGRVCKTTAAESK